MGWKLLVTCCGWDIIYLSQPHNMEPYLEERCGCGSSVDLGRCSWPRLSSRGPSDSCASGADRGWQSQSRHCPSRGRRSREYLAPIISPDRLNTTELIRNNSDICNKGKISMALCHGNAFLNIYNLGNFEWSANIQFERLWHLYWLLSPIEYFANWQKPEGWIWVSTIQVSSTKNMMIVPLATTVFAGAMKTFNNTFTTLRWTIRGTYIEGFLSFSVFQVNVFEGLIILINASLVICGVGGNILVRFTFTIFGLDWGLGLGLDHWRQGTIQ